MCSLKPQMSQSAGAEFVYDLSQLRPTQADLIEPSDFFLIYHPHRCKENLI